jgi:NADPH2:quinone reductase
MRQLQAAGFGAPSDVLRVVDVADPELGPGEVRLAGRTVGLNFLDAMLCRGSYPVRPTPPFTPGVEVVGEIVEVGAEVTDRHVGERVLACPTLPRGALGERVVVDAGLTVVVPPDADAVELAALPVNYQTAWFALRRARVVAGETVLVHAGAGGVGIAAIQLATAWGARAIATAGGPDKVAVCLAQGASEAIDYRADDFGVEVERLTQRRGVDIVIDPVGGSVFARSLACLAFDGRIVPIGTAGGHPDPVDPMAFTATNTSLVGLSWGSAYPQLRPAEVGAAYLDLFAMLGRQVRPVIDRVVALDEVPQALTDLENRATIGKIVVRIRD